MKSPLFTITILLVTLHFASVASAAAPTSKTTTQKESHTYAMIVFLNGIEFWQWPHAGARDAAKSLGCDIKVELMGPKKWDATLEALAVLEAVEKKVDGILLSAAHARKLDAAIDRAIQAGIPVVTFDADAPLSKRLAFVGSNNRKMGEMAGQAMAGWLQEKGGGALGVSTTVGSDHMAMRLDGFKRGVNEIAPGTKIYEIDDRGDADVAYRNFLVLLKSHPDIRGLFGTSGEPGPSAARVRRELELEDKIDILAFDFGAPVVRLIERGEIRGTVAQRPYQMGYYALILAHNASHPSERTRGKNNFGVIPERIDTGSSILGKSDMSGVRQAPTAE